MVITNYSDVYPFLIGTMARATASVRAGLCCSPPPPPPSCLSRLLLDGEVAQREKEGFPIVCGYCL